MVDHWFYAIYENELVQFKFKYTGKFNHKCWIVTVEGSEILVDTDKMIFGERDHLKRKLNEETISRL